MTDAEKIKRIEDARRAVQWEIRASRWWLIPVTWLSVGWWLYPLVWVFNSKWVKKQRTFERAWYSAAKCKRLVKERMKRARAQYWWED